MAAALKALQAKLEAEAVAFRDIQKGAPPLLAPLLAHAPSPRGALTPAPPAADINKAEAARGQCAHQFSENDMVIKELERLEPDAAVFKRIGPVLIRQDLVEARANVNKRLEYIKSERRERAGLRGV